MRRSQKAFMDYKINEHNADPAPTSVTLTIKASFQSDAPMSIPSLISLVVSVDVKNHTSFFLLFLMPQCQPVWPSGKALGW